MKHCLLFSREIFYVTIVLCLNILWLKAVDEITARQTRTSLHEYDVIKVCSIEYILTSQIESVNQCCQLLSPGPFTKEYLSLGLLSSLWNIYHSTTAYLFRPTLYIIVAIDRTCIASQRRRQRVNNVVSSSFPFLSSLASVVQVACLTSDQPCPCLSGPSQDQSNTSCWKSSEVVYIAGAVVSWLSRGEENEWLYVLPL